MNRRTITFNDALLKTIEDWRAKQRPIPKFQDAVEILLNEALEDLLSKEMQRRKYDSAESRGAQL